MGKIYWKHIVLKKLRMVVGCNTVGWFPLQKPPLVLKEILSLTPVSFAGRGGGRSACSCPVQLGGAGPVAGRARVLGPLHGWGFGGENITSRRTRQAASPRRPPRPSLLRDAEWGGILPPPSLGTGDRPQGKGQLASHRLKTAADRHGGGCRFPPAPSTTTGHPRTGTPSREVGKESGGTGALSLGAGCAFPSS